MTGKEEKMEQFYKKYIEPEEKKLFQALRTGLASSEVELNRKSINIIQRKLIPATKSNPYLQKLTIDESVRILKLLIEENRAPKTEHEIYILEHSVKDFYAKQVKEGKFGKTIKSGSRLSKLGRLVLIVAIILMILYLIVSFKN